MPQEEPDRRTILVEVAVYALMFLLVGAAFVAVRVLREGPRVLTYDVRSPR